MALTPSTMLALGTPAPDVELLAPRLHQGRPDDLHDVGRMREVHPEVLVPATEANHAARRFLRVFRS